MAGKSDVFENDLLKLIFNAIPIALIADNAATTPLTNLYVSLHTGDPGEAGVQTTNETGYTGYARVAVLRTTGAGGWTVTNNSVSPATEVSFGQCSAAPGAAITHVGVGSLISGAGKLMYFGAISPSITLGVGVIPRITTASTITED